MNPYDRLRSAINKVNIQYKFPEQIYTSTVTGSQEMTAHHDHNETNIDRIWQNKQSQLINKIKALSSKNQLLSRALKQAQFQNEQLVRQLCENQKKNQSMKQQYLILLNKQHTQIDRQKDHKYLEEIARVNLNVQDLMKQVNIQRNAKNKLIEELNKLTYENSKRDSDTKRYHDDLNQKIITYRQQIEQRTKMFEYNIKKNSQDKVQLKKSFQQQRKIFEQKIQDLTIELKKCQQNYLDIKSTQAISSFQQQSNVAKIKKLQDNLKQQILENNQKQKQIEKIRYQKSSQTYNIDALKQRIKILETELTIAKNDVKVKVVEVKDETSRLQLQMYKKQCRQLLAQKQLKASTSNEVQYERAKSYYDQQSRIISSSEIK